MISNCDKCFKQFKHRKKDKNLCDKCIRTIGGPCILCYKTQSYRWYINKSVCSNCYLKNYKKENPLKAKEYDKKSYYNYKDKPYKKRWKLDKVKKYMKQYWLNNKDKKSEYGKKYYNNNRELIRVKQAEYNKEYAQRPEVKKRMNFSTVKRQKRTKNATPLWADMNKIKEIYTNCPKGYEVDHIIPLQHPKVCGLHVENNLQYLTKHENRSKHNKCDLQKASFSVKTGSVKLEAKDK